MKLVAYEFSAGDSTEQPTSTQSFKLGEGVLETRRWKAGAGNVGFSSPTPRVLAACYERRARRKRSDHPPDCGCQGSVWYEVSAPKVLGGVGYTGHAREVSNLMLAPPEQLYELGKAASDAVLEHTGMTVAHSNWRVSRLDVAADFSCESAEGRQLIAACERVRLPRLKPSAYGHGETAMHGARRNVFRVYDKGVEAGIACGNRNADGRRIPDDGRPRLRVGELVRFEVQTRFEKQQRQPAWSMSRRAAGRYLYAPVAYIAQSYPEVELSSAITWGLELISQPERWPFQGVRGQTAARLAAADALVLERWGRHGLLNAYGDSRGYRALSRLRSCGFALAADPALAEHTAPLRVSFAAVVEQIAEAFHLPLGRRDAA